MSFGGSPNISNSGRSGRKLTEQTMIQVRIKLVQHTHSSNMSSMTQKQEPLIRRAWPPNAPGDSSAEDDSPHLIRTLTKNTRRLWEQLKNRNELTQKCTERHALPTPREQFFHRYDTKYHSHVSHRSSCLQTSHLARMSKNWD